MKFSFQVAPSVEIKGLEGILQRVRLKEKPRRGISKCPQMRLNASQERAGRIFRPYERSCNLCQNFTGEGNFRLRFSPYSLLRYQKLLLANR